MTALDQILTAAPTVRVGLTLLHFLWQAALVAAVLAVALRLLRRRSANVRYLVATGALLVLAAAPVATFLAVEAAAPAAAVTTAPPATEPPQAPPAEPLPEPPRETYTAEPAGGGYAPPPQAGPRPITPRPVAGVSHDPSSAAAPAEMAEPEPPKAPPPSWRRRAETVVRSLLPHVVAGWACGVLLLALWRLGGWRRVSRLRHVSTCDVRGPLAARFAELADALGVRRAVRLLTSTVAAVPMVVGYFRPVVLLPTAAVAGLSPQQVEAILAHELAHIRRHDFLVNTIQIVIETLLFYHPAVWWISRRIRVEREDCCDDAAVAVCPSRVTYARALATLAELPSRPMAAVAASGGRLLARIRRIVGLGPARGGSDTRRWGAWTAAVVVLAGLVTAGAVFYGCGTESRAEDAAGEPATWSKTVDGLQCRLLVANDELTFEVRNVSGKPITIGLHNGVAPPLDIRIKGYPRLSSPPIYSGAATTPHVLKPGQTFHCKLAQHYLLAYGRLGGSAWRFDPAGKMYRIRVMMPGPAHGGLASNEVSVKLPHRPKPARHWPPPGRPVRPDGAWSKPSPEGLQTRIAAHATAFALGDSIVMRMELRHKDGKSWARGVAADLYVGTIVVADVTGKTVGRGKIGLDFHTMIRKNETRVIGLMDLSDKTYGVTAQGKYTVRFEHTLTPQAARHGLVALPAAPPFTLIVLPPGSGHGRPPKPPAGRADPEAARAKAQRMRLADVPMAIVAIGGGDPDLRATLHAAMNLWSDEKIPHTGDGATDQAAWEKWWQWRPGKGMLSRAEIARRVRPRPRQPGDDSHAHVPKYYAKAAVAVPVTPPGGKLRTAPKTFERIWVVPWVPGRLAQSGGYIIVLDAATGKVLVRAADGVKAAAVPRKLTRDHELALRELLRRSEVVVVGKLRLTNDSTANKMWAGHIDVRKVLRGTPSLRDVHVHFQHPNARGGSARRYEGQEGIWFVFKDSNTRTVIWPSQLKPAGFEATLRPYLKANYTAPAPKSTIPADAKVMMRICDVGRKPVPLPPRLRRVFLAILARPAGRCAPVSAFLAEDGATFEVDSKAYAWSGTYIQTLARVGGQLWPRLAEFRACPRLESLFHLMMKERTPTDQRLAGVLEKFERMLAEGKVPATTAAARRASERLAATRQLLTKAVGGQWVEQTIEHHPLGPILVGRVEIAEIKGARPARAAVYVVLPFPLEGAGKWRVFAEYGDRGFSVLGTNDARTVLTNASACHEPTSRAVMKALALSPTRVTLAAMELAEYFKRHPAKFALTVRYADGKPTGRGRLRLATAAPVGAPAGERFVRISEHRVRLLVDHLLEQGMLEPFGQRVAPGAWPRCLLEIHGDLPGSTRAEVIRNDLGGRLAVQGHLVGLRQWLTGKSAAGMDKLLVAVDALADTDNGLQLWLKVRRATLEWGEPVRAIAEFRYLKEDANRVLGDATTARGRELVLCADGPGGKQRKTVEIRRLAGMMPLRPDPPTAEWFRVNLGEHLSLREPGVYRVWAEHSVKAGGKAGAWNGSVRTAPVRIEIKPHPSGLLWSRPVDGLRGSIRPLREGKRLRVEVRLQNAGTKRLTILPFDEGKLNYERTYGAAIRFWLLSPEGNSVEKEQPDAAAGLRRLKMLAQMEQPGFPGVRLLGGELYKTTISVDGAGETGHFHRLAKARHDRPGKLTTVYDTRRFVKLAEQVLGQGVWNAHLMIPAVAIPLAKPAAPARGEARAARVLALAGEADRIIVGKALPQQEGEAPLRIDVTKTLKGSLAGGARQNVMLIGERESPRSDLRDEDKHVIVLLRVEGHNRGWAQLLPPRPINWFLPWSQVFEKRLRAAIPLPAKWGRAIGGLRLGLRPRGTKFTLGGEISVEIAIQNVGARGVKLLQHRLNIYDYYGFTRFTITDPKGRRFVLAKPVGPMLEADFALARTLGPGEAYIHTVHLNCWPLATDMGAPQQADPRGPFGAPGTYTVNCTYRAEAGKKRGCWSGILISPEVRFEIVRPAPPAANPKIAAPAKWATSDVALDSAVSRAATVVRATAKDAGQVVRRHRMTYSAGRPGEGVIGGGVFERVQRRQTFRVVEVLRGSHQAGELTVSYSYRESGEGMPAPKIRIGIPAKAAAILLLDAAGKLLKALPDTPANRTAVRKPAATMAPDVLRRLWEDLGSGDTAAARKAMWTLAAADQAVTLLAARLAPPAADAAALKRLIADLDSEKSTVRAKAFDALGRMDRAAEVALRAARAAGLSVEARERVDLLLAACRRPLFDTAATRRMVRAVWTLEIIGTAAARAVLEKLSKLDARCRTTHLAGRPKPGGEYAPKLRYEVEAANTPDANRIKLDGRMRFKVRLVNVGLVPVAVYWGDYPYEDMYRFAVTREDGSRVPPPRKRFTPPLPVLKTKYFPEIAPGQSVSYDVYLMPDPAANAQTYFFRRPGKHTIRASLAMAVRAATERDTGETRTIGGAWTGVLTAPPVAVTVAGDAKVLTEGRRLSGRVVDAAGKGVADAKVLVARRVRTDLTGYKGPFYEQPVEHTFTAADGRFSFIRLPADAACFVLTTTHPRRASATAKVIATGAAKLPDARIVLSAGLTARGVVVDAAGRALAGVRVSRGDPTTFTDSQGRFALGGLPNVGPVRLSLWKSGFVARDASAPRGQATGGKWSVKIWRKRKLAFSGRAVFADGRPAGKLRLRFHLKDPSGRTVSADADTDSSGHFTAELSSALPGAGEWTASVEAEEEDPNAGQHRMPVRTRWWATVQGIAPGRKDVKIVFDDRGEIAVAVKPTNALPASFKFDVRCEKQLKGRFFQVAELGSKGGRTSFRRLSPGTYMVYAKSTASSSWPWEREVTVGSKPENRKARAEFVLPPLRFGALRAVVLGPDGKTPVNSGRVRYGSSASSGSFVIRDGLVELKDFPVGGVYLEISGVVDMARRTVRGMVYEGRTTDLGWIVLQRLEDVSGWVTGRVLYDDGSPALGATLVNEGFGHTPVKADGSFRTRLPAGDGMVVVDLGGAAAWPSAGSGGADADNVWRATDRILAPVQVKAGKTVKRDIVLPRTKLGRFSIGFKAKAQTLAGILVVVQLKDCRFVRTVLWGKVAPGTVELGNVPAGARVIVLISPKTGYRGCKEVSADKDAVTFDPAAVGSIVVRTAGGPIPGLTLSARPAALAWVKPVRGLRSDWAAVSSGAIAAPPPKAGRSVLAGLCPGKYVVEARPEGLFAPKTVSVAAGSEVAVELVERAKLPGNGVTLREAIDIKGGIALIAVCEASENVSPTPGPSGVYGAIQRFKVATVLTGAAAGGKSIRLWYSVLFPPKQERTIRKGERVIWVVQRIKDGRLVGIKALADTPANRAVAKAAAKPKPPARFERARPNKRPPDPPAGPEDFERLVRALKARLPAGWVASSTTGKVRPAHWLEGQGTLIALARKDFKPLDMKLGKGGQVRIWVMAEGYTAKRPDTGGAVGAQTGAAVELARWCRRRVLVWPGGEQEVPERTIGQALGATWRAAVLLRKLDSFRLALRFRDRNIRSRPSVVMSVAETKLPARQNMFHVRISKADARKIIEYLMMEGFLGQAVDPTVMMGVGVRVIMGPRYVLSAGTDEYGCWSILGWGWPMLKRLVGLRSVLTGDAAKRMDAVLGPMRAKHGDRPGDIRAELVFDKAEYFIGENILLHYGLTNRSAGPLTIDWGGDYRTNARRPLRLKVVAVDAKGTGAEDPCPSPMCMGGRGGPKTLKPGETFWMSAQLMRYCDFDRPGVYHVRAYHDLGWDPGGDTSTNNVPLDARFGPIAEATVKLVLPTAVQAGQVVQRTLAMPPDPGWSVGKRRVGTFPDFTTLRHPVYLPIVTKLAAEGNPAGLTALGAAATPGVTRALIELARSPKAATAAAAMDALVQRLPDPNVSKHPSDATRRRLIRRSWRADMAPAVLALAWELLARKDRKDLIRGGRIVRALGRKEDMPRLLKVYDRTLTLMKDDDVEQRAYPRPANACGELFHASRALLDRGAAPPTDPRSAGEAVLFMMAVGRKKDFRPDGWRGRAGGFLKHPIPYVRAIAAAHMPLPLDEPAVRAIAELVHDEYPPVQYSACALAAKARLKQLGPPLLEVVRTSKNPWIIPAAYRAAVACGVGRDRLVEVCAGRIDQPGMNRIMFTLLIDWHVHTTGYGQSGKWADQAGELKKRWLKFLEANRKSIRAGVRFEVAQPPLTADLFPRGFQLHRPDLPAWPPKERR